ncbi:MAG: peptide chain release factor N(5)-glutamine methyltransferase [Firmicutes bacterium]|nr:peptide chain release factor N(5)-glutamine methyltransferase [Bacillota bacterium]
MGLCVREIITVATNRFEQEGCLDPKLDAELLMMHMLHVDRSWFFTHAADPLSDETCEDYFKLVDRRASGIPVQYIIGSQEFMGLRFYVDESVLIPRQDTELLVETALEELKTMKKPALGSLEVLDLCTGSGAIAVSLGYYDSRIKVTATDISSAALKTAKKNAGGYNLSINFQEGDLWEAIGYNEKKQKGKKQFDMICSNPPYIPSDVIPGLMREVKDHEPILALDGGQDGMDLYRRIFEKAGWFLKPQGVMLLEIGHDQGELIIALAEEYGFTCEVLKDLAGHDRTAICKK